MTTQFAPHAPNLRNAMIEYIKEHFADILGPSAALLDEEGGLDEVAKMLSEGRFGGRI